MIGFQVSSHRLNNRIGFLNKDMNNYKVQTVHLEHEVSTSQASAANVLRENEILRKALEKYKVTSRLTIPSPEKIDDEKKNTIYSSLKSKEYTFPMNSN